MAFYIGQEVECVDDKNWTPAFMHLVPNLPVKGGRYRIRSFRNGEAIRLMELTNPVRNWRDGTNEPAFLLHRFRPVRKTDISIFTAMLNPKSVETVDG